MASTILAVSARSADLSERQTTQYQSLRKDFFVVMALPRQSGRQLRKEHLAFLKDASRFVRSVRDTDAAHAAGGRYLRGRLLLKLRLLEKAREDFDVVLAFLSDDAAGRPGGLANAGTVAAFRAFSFLESGTDRVLQELEAIPQAGPPPREADVGNLVRSWADQLADKDQVGEAIRALQIVERFTLWEEEADNPKRKIDLLKYRLAQEP